MSGKLELLNNQFASSNTFISAEMTVISEDKSVPEIVDHHVSRGIKLDYFNKQGWGYADSGFESTKDKQHVKIAGNRYMYGGEILPNFAPWIAENVGADMQYEDPPQADMEINAPIINADFIEELGDKELSRRSFLKWERIMHSHGATF